MSNFREEMDKARRAAEEASRNNQKKVEKSELDVNSWGYLWKKKELQKDYQGIYIENVIVPVIAEVRQVLNEQRKGDEWSSKRVQDHVDFRINWPGGDGAEGADPHTQHYHEIFDGVLLTQVQKTGLLRRPVVLQIFSGFTQDVREGSDISHTVLIRAALSSDRNRCAVELGQNPIDSSYYWIPGNNAWIHQVEHSIENIISPSSEVASNEMSRLRSHLSSIVVSLQGKGNM